MSRNPTLIDDEVSEEEEAEEQVAGDQPEADEGDGEGEQGEDTAPGGSGTDSSEESEGEDDYDLTDKFIAADEDEEPPANEAEADRRRKRKRRRREEVELDEEDYMLLEENQVVGVRRKPKASQRKRIRKRQDEQLDAQTKLQQELFGQDGEGLDDLQEGTPAPPSARRAPEPEPDFGSDEDDFIDDDLGGGNNRRRRRKRGIFGSDNLSNRAMQEALEIFGDADDMVAQYEERQEAARRAAIVAPEGGADEPELEEPEPDDEEAMQAYLEQKAERDARQQRQVHNKIEPGMMAKHFMRPEDDAIRAADEPERGQLSRIQLKSPPDWEACAAWIWKQLWRSASDPYPTCGEAKIIENGVREVEGHGWQGEDLQGSARGLDLGRESFRGISNLRSGRSDWSARPETQAQLKHEIAAVLHEIYEEHHEIPVIAMHRKQLCGDLLSIDDGREEVLVTEGREEGADSYLARHYPDGTMQPGHRRVRWLQPLHKVHALSQRWLLLQQRKEQRIKLYQPLASKPELAEHQRSIATLLEEVQAAESAEELDDVDKRLRLIQDARPTSDAEHAMKKLSIGRNSLNVQYARACQAGLYPLYACIFPQAAVFGDALADQAWLKDIPRDTDVDLAELAAGFAQGQANGLRDPAQVLEAVHKIAVAELTATPSVRRGVRRLYQEKIAISTEPTPLGETALNPFHPLGLAKRVDRIGMRDLMKTEAFLCMHEAEKAGLLKIRFKDQEARVRNDDRQRAAGDEVPSDQIFEALVQLYTSGNVGNVSRAYEDLRKRALRDALSILMLQLEREARAQLLSCAQEQVLFEASWQAFELACQAPRVVRDREAEPLAARRFCVVCWGAGGKDGASMVLVMLDDQGGLQDLLFCAHLSGPLRKGRDFDLMDYAQLMAADPQKGKDLQRVLEFITEHVPHVILVGGSSMHCQTLLAYMRKLEQHILRDHPQTLTRSETGSVAAHYADERVAQLWERSSAALEEMPDQPALVRRAMAVGRIALSGQLPLMCSLAATSREVLALNLHALQQYLPQDELYRVVDSVLVTVVSQVGVDVNLAAHTPWLAGQLQFVPGFGPRKAKELIRRIVQQEHVTSRREMMGEMVKRRVFWNAGSVMRISTAGPGMLNEDLDPLDNSRVHPEYYRKLALELCRRAAAASSRYAGDDDEDLAVEKVIGKPELLMGINLVALAEELEQKDESLRGVLPNLMDIWLDLQAPYQDIRPPLEEIDVSKELYLLTGETKDTLKEGRPVQAQVHGISKFAVFCTLSDMNDLEAVLLRGEISSSGDVEPSDRIRKGDTLNARISKVELDPTKIEGPAAHIYLSTASAVLSDEERWEKTYCQQEMWAYHVQTREEKMRAQAAKQRQQEKGSFLARSIFHSSFKNIDAAAAMALLLENPTQSWVLRPSQRGPGQITLTMRLHGGAFHHIDILEAPKSGSVQQRMRLSTPLTVRMPGLDPEPFEDLDDLVANFITPLEDNVKAALSHRRWQEGTWDQVKAVLQPEPRPCYRLALKHDQGGVFYIGKILNRTPHYECFTITPHGFYYRRKVFPTVDKMLDAFKRQPLPEQQMASVRTDPMSRPGSSASGQYAQPSYPQAAAAFQQQYAQQFVAETGAGTYGTTTSDYYGSGYTGFPAAAQTYPGFAQTAPVDQAAPPPPPSGLPAWAAVPAAAPPFSEVPGPPPGPPVR